MVGTLAGLENGDMSKAENVFGWVHTSLLVKHMMDGYLVDLYL